MKQKSIIYADNNEVHNTLEIFIQYCGRDFRERIGELIKKYISIETQTINAFLNISSASAIVAYNVLKEYGFFFTGLQPGGEDFEYMILHNPMSVRIDINQVPYIDEYQVFVDYIEKENGDYVQE